MRYKEFIGVFTESENDPMLGQPYTIDLPATINLDAVEAFNDAGEGCTTVRMQMGDNLRLRVPYYEFKTLYLYSITPNN